ncbi:Ldh family oxidoreductase [Candidatus Poribacteria bacterium]|nr:Ldh family oxidoreductase [Candidatus Poribacteria bacterium]
MAENATHRISADDLSAFVTRLFSAADTPDDIAECAARILVNADLAGHPSHGVLRIPDYLRQIEAGGMDTSARPEITRELPGTASVDPRRGWGHHAAHWSMDLAIRKARDTGMAGVSLDNCNHIGRLGEYAEQAAAARCIGIATFGFGGPGAGAAAPFGGTTRALGTNPIAIGVPTGDDTPFVADFATTIIADGKIRLAQAEGSQLPPEHILDRDGRPSTNPDDFFDGGSLLLTGGHKGYALSLATCLLAALTGSYDAENKRIIGVFLMAIDIGAFQDADGYASNVRSFLGGITDNPPAKGVTKVLAPGDMEQSSREKRLAEGIELPVVVWQRLCAGAEKLGVDLP